MKMQFGVMFCYGRLIILWILFLNVAHARHIQLATQRIRTQSRPRLLIIRPPEGSGQPNRIVVLANSRPKPTNPSPSLSTAITALRETSAAARAGLDRAFGGHPQSAISQRARTGSGTASVSSRSSSSSSQTSNSTRTDSTSSSASGGTRSLRTLLRGMRNRAHGTVGENTRPNIFRLSDGIPRAAPPVLPVAQKFGALNIPRGIEAELRRLQEQAKRASNVRQPNIRPPHGHHEHTPVAAARPSPFHGGVIDLSKVSLHDRGQTLDATSGDAGRTSGTNPRWDIGTLRTSGTLGRNGISSRPGIWDKEVTPGSGRNHTFVKNNDLLQMPTGMRRGTLSSVRKTGSNLRTFHDKTADISSGFKQGQVKASPTLDLQTVHMTSVNPSASFDLSNTVSTDQASSLGSASPITPKQQLPKQLENTANANISAPSGISDSASNRFQIKNPIPASPSVNPPVRAAALNVNATAKLTTSSAETNSTTNTTNTKSVKTKTLKVTTVVKGGTQADIAAAVAGQAEIANAVAQGKEINSSALTGLAKAASGAAKSENMTNKTHPIGSITVKRQPNGESIITLADGQGEPVVLRATGPVKIERIVKPNGRIQFVINPLSPQTTTAAFVDTTAFVDPGEIEPLEEFTTMVSMTSTGATFAETSAWPTSTPFYVDPAVTGPTTVVPSFAPAPSGLSSSEPGNPPIHSTVKVNSSNFTNSTSQNSTSVTKTRTIKAKTESRGIMQLFPSQKIPPPPKPSGIKFGNPDHFNPFFLDTNNYLQNTGINMGAKGAPLSGASKSKGQGVDKAPLQLFPGVSAGKALQPARGQSGVMPQYELLGASPSLQFVSRGSSVP